MRLLHVLDSIDPKAGGVAQAVKSLVSALDQLDVVSEITSFDDPNADWLESVTDYFVHLLGPANNPYSFSFNYDSWARTNFFRFDAIVIHGLWQYSSFGTYKLWKKYCAGSQKLWVMPHGMMDPYFQKAPDRKLKSFRNSIFWHLFERNVLNNSTGVLFTCKEELLLARDTFRGYRPRMELNVGLGISSPPKFHDIDMSLFYKKSKLSSDQPYYLFLSRVDAKKGVDLLISAYNEIADPDSPDLVIAGPGADSPYGLELRKLAGNSSKIHFVGMLRGSEKWGAFYGCKAFILPSHQENFGIAVVEAMACGKPVLISNKINIYGEIVEGGGGFVEEDSLQGTINLLNRFRGLSDGDVNLMGANGKSTFDEYFLISESSKSFITQISPN